MSKKRSPNAEARGAEIIATGKMMEKLVTQHSGLDPAGAKKLAKKLASELILSGHCIKCMTPRKEIQCRDD